jgi:DNA mismatch endonuclease, patch repair protein
MLGNRKRDTRAELKIRTALHSRGLRYYVNRRIGKGSRAPRADIVFPRTRTAIFIDGCFWHKCPEHGTDPETNSAYWSAKLARNVERDREHDLILEELGWTVIRIWEHEDPDAAADRIVQHLRQA